jgi:hypothetical protein
MTCSRLKIRVQPRRKVQYVGRLTEYEQSSSSAPSSPLIDGPELPAPPDFELSYEDFGIPFQEASMRSVQPMPPRRKPVKIPNYDFKFWLAVLLLIILLRNLCKLLIHI